MCCVYPIDSWSFLVLAILIQRRKSIHTFSVSWCVPRRAFAHVTNNKKHITKINSTAIEMASIGTKKIIQELGSFGTDQQRRYIRIFVPICLSIIWNGYYLGCRWVSVHFWTKQAMLAELRYQSAEFSLRCTIQHFIGVFWSITGASTHFWTTWRRLQMMIVSKWNINVNGIPMIRSDFVSLMTAFESNRSKRWTRARLVWTVVDELVVWRHNKRIDQGQCKYEANKYVYFSCLSWSGFRREISEKNHALFSIWNRLRFFRTLNIFFLGHWIIERFDIQNVADRRVELNANTYESFSMLGAT